MLDKLSIVKQRFGEVSNLIIRPNIIVNQKRHIQLNKEYEDLKELMDKHEEYITVTRNLSEAGEIIADSSDPEMVEVAELQLEESKEYPPQLEEEIKYMLIPKGPEDAKNAVMEIRTDTGGGEASVFAGGLYHMYTKYYQNRGWSTSVMDFNEGTTGGCKETIFEITDDNVYGTLKSEAGVRRVQRVPQTEAQRRVRTSVAIVIVLPEAEEFNVELDMADVKIIHTTSTGPGGQSAGTTYLAIRLQHIPTGIEVRCQDEGSQHKNFDKALKVLRSHLYEVELTKKIEAGSTRRKSMVSSGDRSAKTRTYNYPQGCVANRRIGLTLHGLQNIISGDIQRLIDEPQLAENAEKLKEGDVF